MKWTYATLIMLFIGVIALGFYTQNYLAASSEALDKQMLVIEKAINEQQYEKAIKHVESFLRDWDKAENKWSLFIDHSEIDNIEMALAKIIQYISKKEDAAALAEIATARSLIKHLPEREALHPLNIF